MSQVIGDPDELDRFANSLTQFIDTLESAVESLNGSFNALGETWRDEKRVRFEEEYYALQQHLNHFKDNASEHVAYLHALASRLRDYLQS